MKKQEVIDYQDVIDLGGERDHMSCQQYVKEFGHDYFYVTIRLKNRYEAFWCCETRTVEIRKISKTEGDILSRFPVKDLEELKMLVNLFRGATPEKEPIKDSNHYSHAC